MRLPGNEVVLDRSVLLNTLIKRKAISWTKIFSDLQTVLPENVRVLTIRPTVNAQDQLFLDMTVAAEDRIAPPLPGRCFDLRQAQGLVARAVGVEHHCPQVSQLP